jgi:hypothetical protein
LQLVLPELSDEHEQPKSKQYNQRSQTSQGDSGQY